MLYKNLIFTRHAQQKMKDRSIAIWAVEETLHYPERVIKQSSKLSKYIKTLEKRKYQVVAEWKESERKWLVISVWVRGEEDKEPLSVQILMMPFRLVWWIIKKLFSAH